MIFFWVKDKKNPKPDDCLKREGKETYLSGTAGTNGHDMHLD